jgi:hypothetical protein
LLKNTLKVEGDNGSDQSKLPRKSISHFNQVVHIKNAMRKKDEEGGEKKPEEEGEEGKKRGKKKKMTKMVDTMVKINTGSKKNKFKTEDAAEINNFKYNENSGKYLILVKNLIIAFYVLRLIRLIKS